MQAKYIGRSAELAKKTVQKSWWIWILTQTYADMKCHWVGSSNTAQCCQRVKFMPRPRH